MDMTLPEIVTAAAVGVYTDEAVNVTTLSCLTGFSRSTVRRHLDSKVGLGIADKVGEGLYLLTEKGRFDIKNLYGRGLRGEGGH